MFNGDNVRVPIQITDSLVDAVYDQWKTKGFPHYPTDYNWRNKEFSKLLKFDRSTLLKPKDKIVGASAHGLALAWSYMPHHWGIKCGKMKTPMEIWNDEEHFKKGIRKLLTGTFWDQKEPFNITDSDMRSLLRRYSGTQAVSNFRPTAAALMYDKFLEKATPLFGTKAGTTWDMSCGYGGRMLGAIAAGINYIGTDPCTATFEGLEHIKEEWSDKKRLCELYKVGSEEFWPDAQSIDLCFTSPPYYDWEKYSEEETQSYKKYPEVQDWIDGFLWHTMDKCHYGLKVGGILAMNVADTKRIKNFEEETVRIAKQIHYKHIDTWYLQLSSQEGAVKVEPIFIFQK